MNIDELTYKELKQIANIFSSNGITNSNHIQSPMIGKYVLCRGYSCGVHAGELISQIGDEVVLKNSRRLWSWGSDNGVALSGVAQFGMSSGKKVDTSNPLIHLTGIIETILCTDKSRDSINEYK